MNVGHTLEELAAESRQIQHVAEQKALQLLALSKSVAKFVPAEKQVEQVEEAETPSEKVVIADPPCAAIDQTNEEDASELQSPPPPPPLESPCEVDMPPSILIRAASAEVQAHQQAASESDVLSFGNRPSRTSSPPPPRLFISLSGDAAAAEEKMKEEEEQGTSSEFGKWYQKEFNGLLPLPKDQARRQGSSSPVARGGDKIPSLSSREQDQSGLFSTEFEVFAGHVRQIKVMMIDSGHHQRHAFFPHTSFLDLIRTYGQYTQGLIQSIPAYVSGGSSTKPEVKTKDTDPTVNVYPITDDLYAYMCVRACFALFNRVLPQIRHHLIDLNVLWMVWKSCDKDLSNP